jgi:hypothetical protein
MVGPPGTGKTMLAQRLPGILPPMSEQEAIESAAVQSIASRGFDPALWKQRPYRSPHHTASAVALVGGGGIPRPGEISLAMHGVLFLDELPEFERKARIRAYYDFTCRQSGRFSRAIPAGCGNESLPLRIFGSSQWTLPLHAGSGSALSQPHFRSIARSH